MEEGKRLLIGETNILKRRNNFLVDNRDGMVEINISTIRPPKLVQIILFLIGFFCFVFPASLLFINELEFGFGYIITIAIFWSSSAYFFKKFLWNHFGKEVYLIEPKKIKYFYDYGVFKESEKEKEFKNLVIGFSGVDDNHIQLISSEKSIDNDLTTGYLNLIIDDETITSNIPVNIEQIEPLSILTTKLNNKNSKG